MKHQINITINGDSYELFVDPWRTLNEVIREELNLTGTKLGCNAGDCGACTVIVNGKAINSCLTLAVETNNSDILTVEGLTALNNKLHPIQTAFIKKGAIQCGFCTPGMEMSAFSLLTENLNPNTLEIKNAISGNLCRCTGYNKIIEAIYEAKNKIFQENKSGKK